VVAVRFIEKLEKIVLRGANFKYWTKNVVLCLVTMVLSSLMVIVNKLDIPGDIHRLETQWDLAIPVILPFVLAYMLYFPFVYLGWAYIIARWPRHFRPYAFAMMIIGLITGIINIYQTYARAVVDNTDIPARLLIHNLNRPDCPAQPACIAVLRYRIFQQNLSQADLAVMSTVLISISTLVKHHHIATWLLAAIVRHCLHGNDIIWEESPPSMVQGILTAACLGRST
jgi:hypothetical protein